MLKKGAGPLLYEQRHKERILETTKFRVNLENGQTGIGGIIRDVTEQRLAAEKIRRSEELLRTFIDSSRDYIFLKDEKGRNILLNRAVQMYTGRARPVNGHGPGEWFRCDIEVKGDYTSFPSLHVGSYFSLAAVFGESYKISWLTYPAAAWLMYVEFPGHNHWASDIFAGGAIGVAIGQMVMNRRSPPPTGSWRFAPTAGGGGPGIMLQREF